jgi:hypothetical protein
MSSSVGFHRGDGHPHPHLTRFRRAWFGQIRQPNGLVLASQSLHSILHRML